MIDLDFEVELTGFEMGEIDVILDEAEEAKREASGPENDIPPALPGPTVSQPGDLWILGAHTLALNLALDFHGKKQTLIFQGRPIEVVFEKLLNLA